MTYPTIEELSRRIETLEKNLLNAEASRSQSLVTVNDVQNAHKDHVERLHAALKDKVEYIEGQMLSGAATRAGQVDGIVTRLAGVEATVQGWTERWEGTKVRIDRMTGTVDDLLQRFEAWKTVGNEIGAQMQALTETVKTHHEILDRHTELHSRMGSYMTAVKEMLDEMRAAVVGEPKPEPPGAPTLDPATAPQP